MTLRKILARMVAQALKERQEHSEPPVHLELMAHLEHPTRMALMTALHRLQIAASHRDRLRCHHRQTCRPPPLIRHCGRNNRLRIRININQIPHQYPHLCLRLCLRFRLKLIRIT